MSEDGTYKRQFKLLEKLAMNLYLHILALMLFIY